jgi:hypothetical protein
MSDAAIASWARAEEALYGPLLSDPNGYERVVRLVGALTSYLRREVDDLDGLVAAANRGAGLVGEVMPEAAVPWIPVEAAVHAACAVRYRELRMLTERANRAALLGEAARTGVAWVRIVDPGSTVAARVAPVLLVHPGRGLGIRCTTEMDPESGGARFVSAAVVVDPVTGDVLAPAGLGPERAAATPEAREADVLDWQRLIEG